MCTNLPTFPGDFFSGDTAILEPDLLLETSVGRVAVVCRLLPDRCLLGEFLGTSAVNVQNFNIDKGNTLVKSVTVYSKLLTISQVSLYGFFFNIIHDCWLQLLRITRTCVAEKFKIYLNSSINET